LTLSLEQTSERIFKTGEKKYELSEYIPGNPSIDIMRWMIEKLKPCFPETSEEVFKILVGMLKEEQWSDIRIRDAVKECIKTHKYPRITPANILDYDKRIRLYTMDQVQEDGYRRNGSHHGAFEGYKSIKINGYLMFYNERERRLVNGALPEPVPDYCRDSRLTKGIEGHTNSEETKRHREAFDWTYKRK
jgi:hypothetical protein